MEATTRRKRSLRLKSQRNLTAYLLLAPGLLFYIPFHFLPILGVIAFSLFKWKGYSFASMQWLGMENYVRMASDKYFWNALLHNVEIVIVVVIVQTVLALALALTLEQKFRGSTFFRGVYFMPTVLSMVVVGILFSLILSPSQGLMNALLRAIGLDKIQPAWLGEPTLALIVLMAVQVWKGFGLSLFLFIAGLEAISEELLDAAKVDGASGWTIIWRIIIPLLRETTTVVIILITIGCFKTFDLVMSMTGGGPFFATEVLSVRMYNQTFDYNRVGYGSAIAVVLFIITFSASALQSWLRGRDGRVEY
jgi:raffinose/stachyose/melibiose transport system permease protein